MRYLLLLTVLFSAPLHATSIQKWVDDEGNVHYGDAPPADTKSESVRVLKAPSNPGRALPRLNTTTDSEGSGAEEENPDLAAQMQANCERANKNMALLTSGNRVKLNEPSGESRYLDTQEIEERRVQAEKDIKTYCK